jgi:type IV secretory pathway TraG/TraD family ATPase VirD4
MLLRRKRKFFDPLDRVVLRLSKAVVITLRDILASIGILGRSGSAKTSGSGATIMRALIAMPSGGLICGAKPEDLENTVKIFREAGREDDLLIFGPDTGLRFNPIDYEVQHGADTNDLVHFMMTVGESLKGGDSKSTGEDGQFWHQQSSRCLYCDVEIIKQARGQVSAPAIQEFIATAAYSPAQIATPEWQAEFHNQCLKQAFIREKTPIEQYNFDLASAYCLTEFPQMAEKTRSSILAHVNGILHVFNSGLARHLLSTTTNVIPDVMFNGKWLFVNTPPCQYHETGRFIACALKYATQRCILRRAAKPSDVPVIIWCDEAQEFVNSFDSHFLAQCRSHLGAMVHLTQSVHSYYAALPGQAGKHQANALLSNFGTKIFHALGDYESAEFAANLVGRSLQTFVGASMSPASNLYDEFTGRSQLVTSTSEHFEYILQPNRFMNGLRTGGSINNLMCDAIVVRSGQPFANGNNWLQVAFRQQ